MYRLRFIHHNHYTRSTVALHCSIVLSDSPVLPLQFNARQDQTLIHISSVINI
jgi:hypothetical protein